MFEDTIYVYSFMHIPTKRRYIGRTRHKETRERQHITALMANRHTNELMQNDYNFNGHEFRYEILETISSGGLPEGHNREKYYMELFRTYDKRFGYNYKDWMTGKLRRQYKTLEPEAAP